MSIDKIRVIMKAFIESQFGYCPLVWMFIESQFGYCPLVWMFSSRNMNARINRIHVRALRIVYNDYVSSYDELVTKDKSFTIHHRNIQTLAIDTHKVINNISPEIMKEIFVLRRNCMYNIREIFVTHNVRTEHYGKETWNLEYYP